VQEIQCRRFSAGGSMQEVQCSCMGHRQCVVPQHLHSRCCCCRQGQTGTGGNHKMVTTNRHRFVLERSTSLQNY
jgi:hypothetical protein